MYITGQRGYCMFKQGDTVLYGNDGVCKISEITEKAFGDISIEYYILTPVFDTRSTIFVPTNNEKLISKIHRIISPEEIEKIVNECKSAKWIESDLKRSEKFKEIIQSGDLKKITSLIKCIYLHDEEVTACGKKLHKSDENIYKEAIKILYEQIALFFEISKENVIDIVCQKLKFYDLVRRIV